MQLLFSVLQDFKSILICRPFKSSWLIYLLIAFGSSWKSLALLLIALFIMSLAFYFFCRYYQDNDWLYCAGPLVGADAASLEWNGELYVLILVTCNGTISWCCAHHKSLALPREEKVPGWAVLLGNYFWLTVYIYVPCPVPETESLDFIF